MKIRRKKVTHRIIEAAKDAIEGISGRCIVASFQKLLDSRKTAKFPNLDFSFLGPAEDLLKRMREASGEKGLPETADQLVDWVKSPPNARLIRQAGVAVELPEKFCNRKCTFVRLERAPGIPEHKPFYIPF
jgi:hypothetical protein